MNNVRRKQIEKVIAKLEELKDEIDLIKCDEEEYHDNIPENLQESDRAYASEEAIENLDCAFDAVDEVIEYLNEAAE